MISIVTGNNYKLRSLSYFFDSQVIYKEILNVREKYLYLGLPKDYGFFKQKDYEATGEDSTKLALLNISIIESSIIINKYKLPLFLMTPIEKAILYGEIRDEDYLFAYPTIISADSEEVDGNAVVAIVIRPQAKARDIKNAFCKIKSDKIFELFIKATEIDPLPEYRKPSLALNTTRGWYWKKSKYGENKTYGEITKEETGLNPRANSDRSPYISSRSTIKNRILEYSKSLFKAKKTGSKCHI